MIRSQTQTQPKKIDSTLYLTKSTFTFSRDITVARPAMGEYYFLLVAFKDFHELLVTAIMDMPPEENEAAFTIRRMGEFVRQQTFQSFLLSRYQNKIKHGGLICGKNLKHQSSSFKRKCSLLNPIQRGFLQLNFEENALCHNLANFFQNSNFDIARAKDPSALALAMSKFEF